LRHHAEPGPGRGPHGRVARAGRRYRPGGEHGDAHAGGAGQAAGERQRGTRRYYTVKPGDTLIRIGLDTGQNWKDLVRWNNIENPNVLEVGSRCAWSLPASTPARRRAGR
jgi:hypothetical protein